MQTKLAQFFKNTTVQGIEIDQDYTLWSDWTITVGEYNTHAKTLDFSGIEWMSPATLENCESLLLAEICAARAAGRE